MEALLNTVSEQVMVIPFLTGILFSIAAGVTLVFPPRQINYLYGYRTRCSMKNQKVWDFSQRYSGIKMLQIGLGLVAVSFLTVLFRLNEGFQTGLGVAFVAIGCGYLFLATESAIRKKFPNQ
ncbi:SdpI family protein [Flavobacterium sp.]